MHDALWLTKLASLTDLTAHCNKVHLELQGKAKTITQLFSYLRNNKFAVSKIAAWKGAFEEHL